MCFLWVVLAEPIQEAVKTVREDSSGRRHSRQSNSLCVNFESVIIDR
jgi:hypothetical protein